MGLWGRKRHFGVKPGGLGAGARQGGRLWLLCWLVVGLGCPSFRGGFLGEFPGGSQGAWGGLSGSAIVTVLLG